MTKVRWDDPQVRSMDVVPRDSVLTHVGRVRGDGSFNFAETPKWRTISHDPFVEVDVSMIEGRWSVAEAWKKVRRLTAPLRQQKKDAARYFRAGDLQDHAYYTMRTPTENISEHVSVYGNMKEIEDQYPGRSDILVFEQAHHSWWTASERVRLEQIELERVRCEDAD